MSIVPKHNLLTLWGVEDPHEIEYRECIKCGETYPDNPEYFRYRQDRQKDTSMHYRRECRKCESLPRRQLNRSVKLYERVKPDCCDACGLKTDKLNLDHDHATSYIRGYLCDNCNAGIAKLGDNATEVQKRLDYLIQAEEEYNELPDELKLLYRSFRR